MSCVQRRDDGQGEEQTGRTLCLSIHDDTCEEQLIIDFRLGQPCRSAVTSELFHAGVQSTRRGAVQKELSHAAMQRCGDKSGFCSAGDG